MLAAVAHDRIRLGHAPRPTDGADLARRIRALVIAAEPSGVRCTTEATATMDGADVADLDIDLSGTVIADAADRDRSRLEPQGAVVSREDATVRRMRVLAQPLRVAGADVRLDAELEDVPIRWLETDANETAVEMRGGSDERPVRGRLVVAVPEAQLAGAIRRVADAMLREHGVTIAALDLDVRSSGPRELQVVADAKVRKGFLSASVHGGATATVDDQMGLTLRGITVESGNPLVGALLAVARGRIHGFEGERIDLVRELPEGIRVQDVRVDVGDEVVLEARLG